MLVVVDTNILVSSLFNRQGNESAIVGLIAARQIDAIVSKATFWEYEEVLTRRKFRHFAMHAERLLRLVESEANWVEPNLRLAVSNDQSDNRFLECCEFSQAHYLITGNLKHFPSDYKGTQILNAAQFLRIHRMWDKP